jgi:hypothetical protein
MPLLWRRVNLTNKIQSPSSKRPRLDNRMHQCSRQQMNISMLLILLTTFVVSKTISYHGRPIKASSLEKSLHLGSQLMSTTNTFMNLCHSHPSLIRTQSFKKQIIRGATI